MKGNMYHILTVYWAGLQGTRFANVARQTRLSIPVLAPVTRIVGDDDDVVMILVL
jgi:hypothetical protein